MLGLAILVASVDTLAFKGCGMRSILEGIFSDKSLRPVALSELKRPRTPNSYLAADGDQTQKKTSAPALRLAMPVERAQELVREIMLDTFSAEERESEHGLLFIDRSALMRFPDGLYAWFDQVEGEGGAGTMTRVALFSRSVYGRRDFGVNLARVDILKRMLESRDGTDAAAAENTSES